MSRVPSAFVGLKMFPKLNVAGSNPVSRSAKSLGNSAIAEFPLWFRTRSETRFGHLASSGQGPKQGGALLGGIAGSAPALQSLQPRWAYAGLEADGVARSSKMIG